MALLNDVAAALGKRRSCVCRLSLPFGAAVLHEGQLAQDISLPVECRDKQWASLPLGLVVERSAEVFRHVPEPLSDSARGAVLTYPLAIIRAGEFFGVFEAIDRLLNRHGAKASWNMTAGVRSVHLIAALDDRRLRDHFKNVCGLSVPDGVSLARHSWELMRALTRSTSTWRMRCLLFPDCWFTDVSPASRALRTRLLEIAWQQSAALRQEALRHDELGTWCAHESQRLKPYLKGLKERLIVDSATPGLLQLVEGVVRGQAIGLSLSQFAADSYSEAFVPMKDTCEALKSALAICKVHRTPLLALPSAATDRPRYIPLNLPLRRMPQHASRGWPDYLVHLGELLQLALVTQVDPRPYVARPEINVKAIDLIAAPPRMKPNQRPQLWNTQLGTQYGKLLPADNTLRTECEEVGSSGDGVVAGSPFFAACIRVNVASNQKKRAAQA